MASILHFFPTLLLQATKPPTATSGPSWQWIAVWVGIVVTATAAWLAWHAQHRNRIQSIMPKLQFYRDHAMGAWILENFGQGNAGYVLFGELDANETLKHYIELRAVAPNKRVAFMNTEFKHCMKLVAKYADTAGRKYYVVCQGEHLKYPRRDPFKAWSKLKLQPESAYRVHIQRL